MIVIWHREKIDMNRSFQINPLFRLIWVG